MNNPSTKTEIATLLAKVEQVRGSLNATVLGQEQLIGDLLVAILAGGHVLLEGLPGLGKTLLVRSLGQGLGLAFTRIQFTPDLMPTDVTGTTLVDEVGGKRTFRFQPGPIFGGLVLADEINRATPKTQCSLQLYHLHSNAMFAVLANVNPNLNFEVLQRISRTNINCTMLVP